MTPHTAAADMVEDSFPHGTPDGYRQGCRGRACPAGADHGLSCSRAVALSAGDYRYQKLARTGMTPGEIADALGLHPEIAATGLEAAKPLPRELAPERVPVAAKPEAPRPAKWSVRQTWVAFSPEGDMCGPFDGQPQAMEFVADKLRPATPKPKAPRRPMSTEELGKLRELHAKGLSDTAIAKKLGRVQPVVSSWRRRLGLASNGKPVGAKAATS
jgi:hypothetical protein